MKRTILICFAAFFLFAAGNTSAQILNPKKILERKANKILEKKTDQAVDSILNNKGDDQKKEEPKKNADNKIKTDTGTKAEQPSLQLYSKYDFIPGEKVVFFDDFSQDNVGDFPALWNTNGSAEVVTSNLFADRWMKFAGNQSIWTDELLLLPDNYTIEFDIVPIKGEEGRMAGYGFRLMQSINAKAYDHGAVPGKAGFAFFCEYFGRPGYRTYINGEEGDALGLTGHKDDDQLYQKENQLYHISIWVQKARVRLYANESKLIDLPKAFPLTSVKMDRIRFEDGAAMISNVRIAVGNPDMRNKLITEGKIVSYGIYFDVNKDVLKPESYGSLKEIANILNENAAVKIKIVGHTDADGADAANLDLSKRRAAAVKNELVKTFGIDAARMETDGKGETQPVAANDKPANKALNRRVEFIKL
ncbi:OmpA family protein [Ferruginibacter sp.]|nr:OmpA family protein [Ferruginibacter sp.]